MSASFRVFGEMFTGTNGAVEAYVEAMAALAAERFGSDDPLAAFLRDERDGFWSGKLVVLDDWLRDTADRDRFLALLDGATERLLREGTFSQYGVQWVASVVSKLRERIVGGDQ
jgi:hypothetical protein